MRLPRVPAASYEKRCGDRKKREKALGLQNGNQYF